MATTPDEIAAEYHAATRAAEVDVLAGVYPPLRVRPHIVPATPHYMAPKTAKRFRGNVGIVFRKLFGKQPQDDPQAFHDRGLSSARFQFAL